MLKVLTDKGLKTATVSQLKQNTNFKGWVCQPNQYVIDVEKWTVRQTVCGHPDEQSIGEFVPIKETICPNDNCFCGNDIEMRKGKTHDFLKLIKHAPDKIDPYRGEKILAIDNKNRVNVNFYTEKKCNYSCSYCEPENHSSTKSIDIEKYKEAWNTVNPKNVSTINISGGEPTLNKKYIDFVKWLSEHNPYAHISTSTNGSKSADYLRHLNTYSHLAISIHFEFITESYIKKLHRFLSHRNENKKSVRLKCMLHPEKIQQVKSFMDGFKGYPDIQVSVTPLWTPGTKDIMEYEEEVWSLVT
tara:strand:- start:1872 stop:2774 length:903 start_codon:yes stop_codon:yes gene_type:complete